MHKLFNEKDIDYDLRNPRCLLQPKVRTNGHGIASFSYYGSKVWNSLPSDIKCSVDISEFKRRIHEWSGPSCSCFAVSCVKSKCYK